MTTDDLPGLGAPQVDPHPAGPSRFVGRVVSFTHDGKRLLGTIEAASFIGYTQRGAIPDYRLTVRGKTGRSVEVSHVESMANFPDS